MKLPPPNLSDLSHFPLVVFLILLDLELRLWMALSKLLHPPRKLKCYKNKNDNINKSETQEIKVLKFKPVRLKRKKLEIKIVNSHV